MVEVREERNEHHLVNIWYKHPTPNFVDIGHMV
jgi:hypothetical protein